MSSTPRLIFTIGFALGLSACSQVLGERHVIKADSSALVFMEDRKPGVGATVTFIPVRPAPIDGEGSPLVTEMIRQVRFDCAGGRLADTTATTLFQDGRKLTDTSSRLEWEAAISGSVGQTILKVGCDDKAARDTRTWNSARTLRRAYARHRQATGS